jgi:hypothetical protein
VNREQFADVIRLTVQDAAVTDTISTLSRPPGRRPAADLVAVSEWFNGRSPEDRRNIEHIVRMTAHAGVFGMLCVLDGARAIENPPGKGTLDLRYRKGREDVSLNDDSGAPLHELL